MGKTESKFSVSKLQDPVLQAGSAAALMALFLLASMILSSVGPAQATGRMPWVVVTAMLLLFALFNSVFCLGTAEPGKYWNRSVLSYLALGALAFGGARLVSGIPIDEAGSFRWLFFVVSFSYLVFISIVNLIRSIVAFAEKEEWHAPKARNKK